MNFTSKVDLNLISRSILSLKGKDRIIESITPSRKLRHRRYIFSRRRHNLVHITHKKLKSPRLPKLLIKHHIQFLNLNSIPQSRLKQTITNKLLHSTKHRIIRYLRHRFPTLKINIFFINLTK